MVKIALLTTFSASVASCAVRVCQCLNTRIDALLAPIWLDREMEVGQRAVKALTWLQVASASGTACWNPQR